MVLPVRLLASLLVTMSFLLAACDPSPPRDSSSQPGGTAESRPAPAPPPVRTGNLLGERRSPYLRLHASQPLHWRSWEDAPFEEAARRQRPVMLVLGFGACHGCHVLARGAFADPQFAEYVNDRFVPVLVDRDERPDVDAVYMNAVRLLTGGAGWPAIVFLDPAGAAFQAYTYGAAAGGERKDLREVVETVGVQVEIGMDVVSARAFDTNEKLRIYAQPRPAGDLPETGKVFGPLMLYLAHSYDREHGGFGDAPRFVRPPAIDFLLRLHRRTGQQVASEMVETTLLRVRQSALHDPVDGGFHRYARGPAWQNPAYEKTLADNAAIAAVYLDAWQATGREELAQTARTTLEFLSQRLRSQAGGFFASLDSEGAGPDGAACSGCYYAISDEDRAAALASPEQRTRLAAERRKLGGPLRHEAILADANGLAIGAFARAAMIFDDATLREQAAAAASFVLERHRRTRRAVAPAGAEGSVATARIGDGDATGPNGDARAATPAAVDVARELPAANAPVAATATLSHCVYEDRSPCGNGDAYLDDYVFLAGGLLDLFEVDPQARWLSAARELADEMLARFEHDNTGGFFLTAEDAQPLLLRPKPDYDSALPSGNSAAVAMLMRLHAFTDAAVYREAAERTLRAFSHVLELRPLTAPGLAAGLDAFDDPFKGIVLVVPDGADGSALREVLARTYLPNRAIVVSRGEGQDATMPALPVLARKVAAGGRATAYVCENHVCRPGTDDPATLRAAITSVVPPSMN